MPLCEQTMEMEMQIWNIRTHLLTVKGLLRSYLKVHFENCLKLTKPIDSICYTHPTTDQAIHTHITSSLPADQVLYSSNSLRIKRSSFFSSIFRRRVLIRVTNLWIFSTWKFKERENASDMHSTSLIPVKNKKMCHCQVVRLSLF